MEASATIITTLPASVLTNRNNAGGANRPRSNTTPPSRPPHVPTRQHQPHRLAPIKQLHCLGDRRWRRFFSQQRLTLWFWECSRVISLTDVWWGRQWEGGGGVTGNYKCNPESSTQATFRPHPNQSLQIQKDLNWNRFKGPAVPSTVPI